MTRRVRWLATDFDSKEEHRAIESEVQTLLAEGWSLNSWHPSARGIAVLMTHAEEARNDEQ